VSAGVLLIENDEALGHWLEAVLREAGFRTEWERDALAALARVQKGLSEFALVVVEGVLGGQGVELSMAAKAQGKHTVLLIPRGASVMAGVADRILEHPLTRVGLEECLRAFSSAPVAVAPTPTPPVAQSTDDDRMRRVAADRLRMGRAALVEGNFDAAIIELDAAAVLSPDDQTPRLFAAWARYARRRAAVREAADLRVQIADLCTDMKSADAHHFAASIAHDFGDVDLALQHVNAALRVDEAHVGARQLLEILSPPPKTL